MVVTPIGYSYAGTAAYLESAGGRLGLCGDIDEAGCRVPGQCSAGEGREVGGDRRRRRAVRCPGQGCGIGGVRGKGKGELGGGGGSQRKNWEVSGRNEVVRSVC
jgi:hypothetical protein